MKKPRNQNLRDSLQDFCTSAIPILLLKHKSELPLFHISKAKAEIDDDGFVITSEKYPKDADDKELIYFIMMHGNLPDYSGFISQYWDSLETLHEYSSCTTEMENDPKISRHFNQVIMVLDTGSTHDVKFFVCKFLEVLFSNSQGIKFDEQIFDEVYIDFEDFLYSDVVKYTAFAAIWGFHRWSEPDLPKPRSGAVQGSAVLTRKLRESLKPIQLTKRARIVPLGFSSIHKSINVQGGFLITTPSVWDIPYVLEFSGSVRKHFKGDKKQTISSSQHLQDEVAKLIGALRLFKKGDIQYGILGSITHSWFRQLGRRALNIPPRPIVCNTYDVTDDDEKELVRFCRSFTGIKYNESLELAMNRFNISYERSQFRDTLIDQMIAFEALLIQHEYKGIGVILSRRVANLLGETIDEKQHFFDEMYDAYYIRSKIVHGDQNNEIASMLASKQKPMIWYIYDVQDILRKIIRKYAQLMKAGQSKMEIINGNDDKIRSRPKRIRRKNKPNTFS